MRKQCVSCGKGKELSEYWTLQKNQDNKDHICIACRVEQREKRESTPAGLYELKARLLSLLFRTLWFKVQEGMQLDHKFSIKKGFQRQVPLEIISNINNLQMISAKENRIKGDRCSITIQELYRTYMENPKVLRFVELMKDKDRATIRRWTNYVLERRKANESNQG